MSGDLGAAARKGDLPVVLELLAASGAAGAALTDALIGAVIHGHRAIVRALLDHGADPNHRYGYDRTALSYAPTHGVEMLDLLLDRGADLHATDSVRFDVLHAYLVEVGPGHDKPADAAAVVRRLLERGLDVRARNADAPHLPKACAVGDVAILELLLDAGADPNARDRRTSVLWEAIKSRHCAAVLAALVRGGIDPNARCKNAAVDTTILAEVCKLGDLASARSLLDRGADADAGGASPPLACAEECGTPALIDLLLERGARPLLDALPAEATYALDVAEREAAEHPDDLRARLAWAATLLEHGFRAAAASEVAAVARRGSAIPTELGSRLAFEAPPGVRWSFTSLEPVHAGVAPRLADERFPGVFVTDGERTVPLVLTTGRPCNACDERGEVVCSACSGSGWFSSIYNDDPVECAPVARCARCRGLKLVVTGKRLGKGGCAHPAVLDEMMIGAYSFQRCQSCGLAALHGPMSDPGGPAGTDFACGVCGRFACSCER